MNVFKKHMSNNDITDIVAVYGTFFKLDESIFNDTSILDKTILHFDCKLVADAKKLATLITSYREPKNIYLLIDNIYTLDDPEWYLRKLASYVYRYSINAILKLECCEQAKVLTEVLFGLCTYSYYISYGLTFTEYLKHVGKIENFNKEDIVDIVDNYRLCDTDFIDYMNFSGVDEYGKDIMEQLNELESISEPTKYLIKYMAKIVEEDYAYLMKEKFFSNFNALDLYYSVMYLLENKLVHFHSLESEEMFDNVNKGDSIACVVLDSLAEARERFIECQELMDRCVGIKDGNAFNNSIHQTAGYVFGDDMLSVIKPKVEELRLFSLNFLETFKDVLYNRVLELSYSHRYLTSNGNRVAEVTNDIVSNYIRSSYLSVVDRLSVDGVTDDDCKIDIYSQVNLFACTVNLDEDEDEVQYLANFKLEDCYISRLICTRDNVGMVLDEKLGIARVNYIMYIIMSDLGLMLE